MLLFSSTNKPFFKLVKFEKTKCFHVGAREAQVDEPRTVFIFELEAYPEAKALSSVELKALYAQYHSFYKIAELIGSSEAFARQNAKLTKNNKKRGI